ncbi:MAG: hypothetical protein FJ100_02050 [Deltaproteobacteria bacterium]|nr:hypothetical protein [Deltaproteobacteria bacterium]
MAKSRSEREFEAIVGDFLTGPVRPIHKGGPPAAKPPAAPPAPAQVQVAVPPPAAATAELAARDAQIGALRAQLSAAEAGVAAAREAVATATQRAQVAEAALASAQRQAREADSERRAQSRRTTELLQQLTAVQRQWAGADRRGLVAARGLVGDEAVEALRLFLAARGTKAVDAMLDRDPAELCLLLERLVVSCGSGDCTPRHADVLVLLVPRDRCEVCAGSDSRQAFSAFCTALRAAGFSRCTVVGGSPAYREMLRDLGRTQGVGLDLRFVADVAPNADQRAKQVRGLVIIWGATAVDHAATSHYRDAGDKVLEIPHRGIGGMLRKAAAELQKNR